MRSSSVDQIILETLSKEHSHLTSHQVFEAILQRLPAVNPSTVYRALERLAKIGKVSISDLGTGSAVYEYLEDGLHHHLVCQNCGRTQTLDHKLVSEFFIKVEEQFDFKVMTNHLVLFGVCSNCKNIGKLTGNGI